MGAIHDFLAIWVRVVVRGGLGAFVATNRKYTGWFLGAAIVGAGEATALDRARWVVLRKSRINEVPLPALRDLADAFGCRFENTRFIALTRGTATRRSPFFESVLHRIAGGDAPPVPLFDEVGKPAMAESTATKRAIVVTTFNRPAALARTLPQLTALGVPVLVVDDGSSEEARDANRRCADRLGALYMGVPQNRGVAAAVNVGVAYWLADPDIAWISYFQDDVDVAPELFEILADYEDPVGQPVMTGLDTNEHETVREKTDRGRRLKFKTNSTGMHLHCHRDYWASVLPVPSRYLGAPKADRGGSGADSWIVKRAPAAVGRRGVNVLCVCGLVTSFAWRKEDSTWGNQHLVDAPARPDPGSPHE